MRHTLLATTRRLGTARELYHRGGAGAVLGHWLHVLGYRRTRVFEIELTADMPITEAAVATTSDFLDASQLDAFVAHHPDIGRGQAINRLKRGDRCFATWVDGRIVSSRWVASDRVRFGDIGLEVDLPADTVYVSHAFTSEDIRGLRIASASSTRLTRRLAEEGWKRSIGTVLPQNRSGLVNAERAGYTETRRLATLRLGPWGPIRAPYLPRAGRSRRAPS
jgi:hypothetical protein